MNETLPRRAVASLATALLASLMAVSVPASAGPPGDNGPIVYITDVGLHVVEADGSGASLVVAGTYSRPDVSPDGTAVLVTELSGGSTTGALVSIDLATGDKTTVLDGPVLAGVWSGDGTRLAYADGAGIWVKEGAAAAVQVSTTHNDIFDWSPVDDRVIVSRSVQNGGFPEYYMETLDVDSRATVVIRDNGPGLFTWYTMDADFSPDGQAIAYSSVTPGVIEIVVTSRTQPLDPGGYPYGNPSGHVAWSPDGSAVAYPTVVSGGGTGAEVLAVHDLASDTRAEYSIEAVEVQWAPQPTEGFTDVPNDHTFYEDILWLADQGITRGCNPPTNDQFCPDDFVTRGQMAAFLVRAFGYTDNGGGDLFTDDDDSTFEGDIDRLATADVTRGCNPPTNDQFCPDDFVTRGQMAAFLHRAFGN